MCACVCKCTCARVVHVCVLDAWACGLCTGRLVCPIHVWPAPPRDLADHPDRLNGGEWYSCRARYDLSGQEDGHYALELKAVDNAGNMKADPASLQWEVDQTAPTTTLSGAPEAVTSSKSAILAFSSDDPAALYQCQARAPWPLATCVHAIHARTHAGAHTLSARGTQCGRTHAHARCGRTHAHARCGRTHAHALHIHPLPHAPHGHLRHIAHSVLRAPSAAGCLPLDGACQVDGTGWSAWDCLSPMPLHGMTLGTHKFEVRAKDPAGNVEPVVV